jgi:hypothetical protein
MLYKNLTARPQHLQNQELILRLLNLQLQRWLEHFFKVEEAIFVFK